MDLKKFLPGKESETREYFWALVIEPGLVQAGIWRIQEKQAQVIFASPAAPWELEEELVGAADTALSSAIQNFPEDLTEPSKAVFGVVSSWVTGGQIKEEYIEKIKKICSELSLKPMGFVVLPEAIANLTKSEEGSPLNAVAIGVYREVAEVTLFKLGNLLGTTSVARSVSIVDDITEGLMRFAKGETLPSRFILYDGREGELEDHRQAILNVNWEDNSDIKFLHTPKVELLTSGRKIQAVSLAGATEMADVSSIAPLEEKETEETGDSLEAVSQDLPETKEETVEAEKELRNVGFVLEKDIADEVTPNAFDQTTFEHTHLSRKEELDDESLKNFNQVESGKPVVKSGVNKAPFLIVFKQIPVFFAKLKNKVANISFGRSVPRPVGSGIGMARKHMRLNKTFLFGIIFFILLLLGGFGFWWFYPKAVVTVFISPQKLEENVELTVDPMAESSNSTERILPGTELKTSVTGEKTKSTTGTKTVGEKAKGEVTLYRVGTELTLPSGTLLTGGSDNLRFSLDSDTKVASGSASTPGTTKAKITSENIGSQYNLATDSSFKIGNYSTSDIEAKNENAFSGGSSREISAISAEDQRELQEDLTDELETKAGNELTAELTAEQFFIDDSFSTTSSSMQYSGKVGDEAETLKLAMKMDVVAYAVRKTELISLAQDTLRDKVPGGFVLRDEQIDVEFEYKDKREGKFVFEAKVLANLLPQVDPDDIAKKISGKHKSLAENFLSDNIPGYSRSTIRITPNFPGRLNALPRVVNNIEVEISADR